jgi:nucleotide-binding universal stress UspA family protein
MKVNKILVPVVGNRIDDEAVLLACSVARRQKAKIYVIYVIEVSRSLPLDADIHADVEKGEQVLDRADRLASGNDATAETEILQAREIGPAIVDEAVERGVDVIIMGVPYRKQFGEFTLGSTANYVLKNSPCAVWVCRESVASVV